MSARALDSRNLFRSIAISCVVVTAGLAANIASAQTQTPTKDPTAVALVQQALAVVGASQNFTDVSASGTTTLCGDSDSVSYPINLMAT